MSAAQIKASLIQQIQQIGDADLKILKAITALLETYHKEDAIVCYNTKGEPQYASDLKEEFKKTIEDVKAGNFVTVDDLENDDRWSRPTV